MVRLIGSDVSEERSASVFSVIPLFVWRWRWCVCLEQWCLPDIVVSCARTL